MSGIDGKGYYFFEQERLNSFKSWKFGDDLPCNKVALAAAGFYKSEPDKVSSDECVCFYCGKELGDWDADDDPFKEHKSHTKNCKFIDLGRGESELKVKELFELAESWCLNHMNEAMKAEVERRSKIFSNQKSLNELKFRK